MANLKSAKKAIRKTKKRTIHNARIKDAMKQSIRKVQTFITSKSKQKAEKAYITATKRIDKAAKSHVIHKNTASRYKSRLARHINDLSS